MARPRPRTAPPRPSEPDLPRQLVAGRLERHAELTEASVVLAGTAVDGAHARLSECRISAASLDRLDLLGAVLADVLVEDLAAAELVARDGTWRSVRLSGGRIGTLDLSRGRWDGVHLSGVRVDYLSVPAATLRDVTFSECRIGTLDAPGAMLERVRFEHTTVDEFDTREMRAADLDLRGLDALAFTDLRALRESTMSQRQVEAHARAFATALGIDVQDDRPGAPGRSGAPSS